MNLFKKFLSLCLYIVGGVSAAVAGLVAIMVLIFPLGLFSFSVYAAYGGKMEAAWYILALALFLQYAGIPREMRRIATSLNCDHEEPQNDDDSEEVVES